MNVFLLIPLVMPLPIDVIVLIAEAAAIYCAPRLVPHNILMAAPMARVDIVQRLITRECSAMRIQYLCRLLEKPRFTMWDDAVVALCELLHITSLDIQRTHASYIDFMLRSSRFAVDLRMSLLLAVATCPQGYFARMHPVERIIGTALDDLAKHSHTLVARRRDEHAGQTRHQRHDWMLAMVQRAWDACENEIAEYTHLLLEEFTSLPCSAGHLAWALYVGCRYKALQLVFSRLPTAIAYISPRVFGDTKPFSDVFSVSSQFHGTIIGVAYHTHRPNAAVVRRVFAEFCNENPLFFHAMLQQWRSQMLQLLGCADICGATTRACLASMSPRHDALYDVLLSFEPAHNCRLEQCVHAAVYVYTTYDSSVCSGLPTVLQRRFRRWRCSPSTMSDYVKFLQRLGVPRRTYRHHVPNLHLWSDAQAKFCGGALSNRCFPVRHVYDMTLRAIQNLAKFNLCYATPKSAESARLWIDNVTHSRADVVDMTMYLPDADVKKMYEIIDGRMYVHSNISFAVPDMCRADREKHLFPARLFQYDFLYDQSLCINLLRRSMQVAGLRANCHDRLRAVHESDECASSVGVSSSKCEWQQAVAAWYAHGKYIGFHSQVYDDSSTLLFMSAEQPIFAAAATAIDASASALVRRYCYYEDSPHVSPHAARVIVSAALYQTADDQKRQSATLAVLEQLLPNELIDMALTNRRAVDMNSTIGPHQLARILSPRFVQTEGFAYMCNAMHTYGIMGHSSLLWLRNSDIEEQARSVPVGASSHVSVVATMLVFRLLPPQTFRAFYDKHSPFTLQWDMLVLPAHYDLLFSVLGKDTVLAWIAADTTLNVPAVVRRRMPAAALLYMLVQSTREYEAQYGRRSRRRMDSIWPGEYLRQRLSDALAVHLLREHAYPTRDMVRFVNRRIDVGLLYRAYFGMPRAPLMRTSAALWNEYFAPETRCAAPLSGPWHSL